MIQINPAAVRPEESDSLRVVIKDARAFAVDRIELPAHDGPDQHDADCEHQHDGQWNQDVQRVHVAFEIQGSVRSRRSALPTTISELAAIPIAASAGDNHPIAASGNTVML